jgi:hypothetical protein
MGSLRFRKQFKLAPGLKLTLNKQSVGVTLGVRGANLTCNTKGQRTASVGLPGTGLWYRDTRKDSEGARTWPRAIRSQRTENQRRPRGNGVSNQQSPRSPNHVLKGVGHANQKGPCNTRQSTNCAGTAELQDGHNLSRATDAVRRKGWTTDNAGTGVAPKSPEPEPVL